MPKKATTVRRGGACRASLTDLKDGARRRIPGESLCHATKRIKAAKQRENRLESGRDWRPSPAKSAANSRVGRVLEGGDGNEWIVKETVGGTRRWVRFGGASATAAKKKAGAVTATPRKRAAGAAKVQARAKIKITGPSRKKTAGAEPTFAGQMMETRDGRFYQAKLKWVRISRVVGLAAGQF